MLGRRVHSKSVSETQRPCGRSRDTVVGVNHQAVVNGKIRQRFSGKQMKVPRECQRAPMALKQISSGCTEIRCLDKQDASRREMVRYPSRNTSLGFTTCSKTCTQTIASNRTCMSISSIGPSRITIPRANSDSRAGSSNCSSLA